MAGLDGFYAARIVEERRVLIRLAAGCRLRYMWREGAGRRAPAVRREASAVHGRPVDRGAGQAIPAARTASASQHRRAAARPPLIRLSFIPRKADRLLIAPQDLRTADGTRASEIYAGRFVFAGKVVVSDGRSPFQIVPPSDEWAAALLGFGWLRHLRAAESGITRANARALVDEWISVHGAWNKLSWQPEIMARRITSWLSQAPLILHDADVQFYRRFLKSLVRQVRYLRHTALEARDGVPRMQALVALAYAALCMAGQARHLRGAVKQLVTEIERQILPDGGHVSRNPGALIELLLDLLPLRHAFQARNLAPPPQLNHAIDRMMPMMRFFRHGDGTFAHFNGMGPTQPDLMATILAYDDARGAPLSNAPHSGYQRIELGELVLLMDTGAPPPITVSQEAHAGCLSFELSHGLQRIVVNCGLPATQPRNLAPGRARHRRALHCGVQRHLVVPVSRGRLVQTHARHTDRQRPG